MQNEKTAGFSTVELLIAMALLALVLSAAVLLSFGGQSLLSSSQTDSEALNLAQLLLEGEQALSRKDFLLVVPLATTTQTLGPLTYTEAIAVQTQTPDYFTKKVTVTVSWVGDRGRPQFVTLTTLVTNFENAVGGSTCDTALSGGWQLPQIKNPATNFATLVGDASNTYTLTGLDAYLGKLYVTASNGSINKPTFFIFDISNPATPALLGSLDNDTRDNTGLAAVAVATSSAGSYAYVASASSFSAGQLQIINIQDPASPAVLATYKIPTTTVPVAGLGNSIFYNNGYIYLGLTKSTGGKELNIIDVHNPLKPFWVGGYSVGNNINAIYVKNDYAYWATPNSENLTVLDVSNPASPVRVGGYSPPGGSNGESVEVLGDTVYLGRTFGTNELYLLNTAAPNNIAVLGQKDIGTGTGTSINGLLVRGNLAFFLTNTELAMFDISNPAQVSAYGTPLALPAGSAGVALDCEGDYLYAASNLGAAGYLSVIHP